jgi:hypothetical protein
MGAVNLVVDASPRYGRMATGYEAQMRLNQRA